MPTDLNTALLARKRNAHAQVQIEITILLVCFIIFLGMFLLLLDDQSFSKASIELLGRF